VSTLLKALEVEEHCCQNCCLVCWFATWKVYCIDISIVSKVIGSVVYQLKCSGDKYVGLRGSLDKAHKGLEFRQLCISASNVEVSSLGSNVAR